MKFTLLLCALLAISMIFTPIINVSERKSTSVSGNLNVLSEKKEENEDEYITILRTETNEKVRLKMRDYIIGVLSAEISPLYSEEAIKAQAVASHTYALYQKEHNVELTDNYKKHQAYISPDEARKKWGDKYEIYTEKITSCIDEVADKVITYDGEIILPAFFALSSGKTENSEDIWGGKRDYLVSVTSVGDKLSSDLVSEETVSREAFSSFCGFDVEKESVISIDATSSGAVKTLTIMGEKFSGNSVQSAFNLKSNNFTVTYDGENFVFTVIGNGHGVGMSQYGADFMARQGSGYEEILKHYYTGVEIKTL